MAGFASSLVMLKSGFETSILAKSVDHVTINSHPSNQISSTLVILLDTRLYACVHRWIDQARVLRSSTAYWTSPRAQG